MKLKEKITINLFDFVETGRFDSLKIGASKEWILNNFPDPDFRPQVEQSSIWNYGNLELHFDEQRLSLIFSDYIGELDGGQSIALDPWIFNTGNLDLLAVVGELVQQKLDFALQHVHYDEEVAKIKLTESGVQLSFHRTEGTDKYYLGAFWLDRISGEKA